MSIYALLKIGSDFLPQSDRRSNAAISTQVINYDFPQSAATYIHRTLPAWLYAGDLSCSMPTVRCCSTSKAPLAKDPPLNARWGLEEPAVLGGLLAAHGEYSTQCRSECICITVLQDATSSSVKCFYIFCVEEVELSGAIIFMFLCFHPTHVYTGLHLLPWRTPKERMNTPVPRSPRGQGQSTLHEFQGKVRRLPCSPSRTSSLCVVTGWHWGTLVFALPEKGIDS